MEFKDIQNTWQQQSSQETTLPDFEPAKQKLQKLRKGQQITQLILGITGIVLIVFFFYISKVARHCVEVLLALFNPVL